jgi:hypothetical protein
MGATPTPYIPKNPGDLVDAASWNGMQVDIKQDIAKQISTAIGQLKSVDHAGDADKLGGQDTNQLTQDIIRKVLEQLPKFNGGYLRTFNRLPIYQDKIINHGLHSCPLVDVYQLDYFKVVCAKGPEKTDETLEWTNIYLYHSSERRIRKPQQPPKTQPNYVDIEPADGSRPFRILFSDMLTLLGVQYSDTTDLDELETQFFQKFYASPNDEFDADQACHSPWFEKCCGEKRSVQDLKQRGDWNQIWFKIMPRKTINYLSPQVSDFKCLQQPPQPIAPTAAPTQVQVVHYDFDNVGLKLVAPPVYPVDFATASAQPQPADPPEFSAPPDALCELKVMVLFKV